MRGKLDAASTEDLARELRRIGVNINQIARALNADTLERMLSFNKNAPPTVMRVTRASR